METCDNPGMSVVRAVTADGKGRVVQAVADVGEQRIIESSPAVELSLDDRRAIDGTSLFPYYFVRPDHPEVYIIFGLASFCSHAEDPNAKVEWRRTEEGLWADLTTVRPIAAGEEVTLRYGNIEQYDTQGWVE